MGKSTTRLKIAFVSPGNTPFESVLLRKLTQKGHEIHLISLRRDDPKFDVDGVEVTHHRPLVPRLKTVTQTLFLRKQLRRIRPDVMLSGVAYSHGFVAATSGFHPSILLPWGGDILHFPKFSRMMRFRARFAVRRADVIVCDSFFMQQRVVELGSINKDSTVVFPPFSVDLARFKPGPSTLRGQLGWDRMKVLIMTRNFHPIIYGVEYFVEALRHVVDDEPDTRAILVGSGSLELDLKTRLEELGLTDHVYFSGRIENDEMPVHLNASDVYVSSSFTDTTSGSLLEAMGCALPVVVSDIAANREWVENGINGMTPTIGDHRTIDEAVTEMLRENPNTQNMREVRARDFQLPIAREYPERLATAIVALLRDPALRARMGSLNRTIAQERGNLDTNADRLVELSHSLSASSAT